MLGSAIVYAGLIALAAGLPIGLLVSAIGFALPAEEKRITKPASHLDEFAPVWQFNEVHRIHVDAPPARVYAAMRAVRAEEILLFRTLTWIRRFGRPLPEGILNPGDKDPIIDIATRGGFEMLIDEPPRELVIATTVLRSRRGRAEAWMNFRITPDEGGSLVSTETRVYANTAWARRRFSNYWRVIYPGSALIRRMWLRAIERRALTPVG